MGSLGSSFAVIYSHLGLGLIASLLFAAGLGTSVAVVRGQVGWMMAFPLWVVRQVLRVIGPGFPAARVFLVIFCFNTIAIFIYMLSGVLIVVPALVAFLTGVNIGVIVLKSGEMELPTGERPLAQAMDPSVDIEVAPWVSLCSLAVLMLELPSFWISVGMGIGMARELTKVGQYTLANIHTLLAPRVAAYTMVIVPALLISAIAETLAIRGHLKAERAGQAASDDDSPAGDDEPGQADEASAEPPDEPPANDDERE